MSKKLRHDGPTPPAIIPFLGQKEYLVDLSFLQELANWNENSGVKLLVPHWFDGVVTDQPVLLQEIIKRATVSPGSEPESEAGLRERTQVIKNAYLSLRARGVIQLFRDEAGDEELSEALTDLRRQAERATGGSKTRGATISRYTLSILNHSRRYGTAILSKGRRLVAKVSGRLAVFELPHKLDRLKERKEEFANRIYRVPGGKAAKTMICIVVAVQGLANPVFGVAGIAFACMDP